jgi:hypothetical protein
MQGPARVSKIKGLVLFFPQSGGKRSSVVMFLIHGYGMYAKVDRVPGLFHVATRFLHLYWMPVVPLQSYLVPEAGRARVSFKPAAVGINWKSVLLAWIRVVLVVGGCALFPLFLAAALQELPPNVRPALAPVVVGLPFLSLALLAWSYRTRWTTPERALLLASIAGIPPEAVAERFADRLQPEDEDRLSNLSSEQITELS